MPVPAERYYCTSPCPQSCLSPNLAFIMNRQLSKLIESVYLLVESRSCGLMECAGPAYMHLNIYKRDHCGYGVYTIMKDNDNPY